MRIVFHTATFPRLRAEWGQVQMLGFGYLAAALRRKFPKIEVLLAEDEGELLALAPGADVIGLTCVTFTWGQARRLAARIREKTGAAIVVGGPHVTALPESITPEFDYAVLGEGEQTFCELIGHLEQRRPGGDLAGIDGLAWRPEKADEGVRAPRINPPRTLIEPLDSLPHPDRELYNRRGGLRRAGISLMTSRGCPYDCTFCSTARHWQRLRVHSADYVLEELDDVIGRYRPWKVVFEDDLFFADRKRLRAIVEGILRRGHHKRTRFHVSGRANLVDDELCGLLHSIGCESIFIGFESASDRSLAALGKRGVSAEVNQRAVDTVRRHGIKLAGSFILGAPGETFDDMHATYVFIRRNLDAFARVETGLLRLFPGTALWQEGLRRGLIDERLSGIVLQEEDITDGWRHLSQGLPMLNDAVSRQELLGMHLALQELAAVVRERNENPSHVDNMGLKALACVTSRKLIQRIFGK